MVLPRRLLLCLLILRLLIQHLLLLEAPGNRTGGTNGVVMEGVDFRVREAVVGDACACENRSRKTEETEVSWEPTLLWMRKATLVEGRDMRVL